MVIDLRANFMDIRWSPNTLKKFLPSACFMYPNPILYTQTSPSLSGTPISRAQNKPPKLVDAMMREEDIELGVRYNNASLIYSQFSTSSVSFEKNLEGRRSEGE
jgi:hypothetical protein